MRAAAVRLMFNRSTSAGKACIPFGIIRTVQAGVLALWKLARPCKALINMQHVLRPEEMHYECVVL